MTSASWPSTLCLILLLAPAALCLDTGGRRGEPAHRQRGGRAADHLDALAEQPHRLYVATADDTGGQRAARPTPMTPTTPRPPGATARSPDRLEQPPGHHLTSARLSTSSMTSRGDRTLDLVGAPEKSGLRRRGLGLHHPEPQLSPAALPRPVSSSSPTPTQQPPSGSRQRPGGRQSPTPGNLCRLRQLGALAGVVALVVMLVIRGGTTI